MRKPGIPLASIVLSCAVLLGGVRAEASVLTYFQTFRNVNYTSAGVGGMRETGYGTIALTNVPAGTVQHAYLYWFGIAGAIDENFNFNPTLGDTNGYIFMSSDVASNVLTTEIPTSFNDSFFNNSGLPTSYTFLNDPSTAFHQIPSMTNAVITNYVVQGQCIGISGIDQWSSYGFVWSLAYRADVTALVANGSGVANGTNHFVLSYPYPFYQGDETCATCLGNGAGIEGASLVVIYNDPAQTAKNDIIIENGCDQNSANNYDPLGWSATVNNINYAPGDTIGLEFHVGDGQLQYVETALYLNGQVFAPANPVVSAATGQLVGQVFWGASPYDPTSGFNFSFFTGSLWDINNYNVVPSNLTPGVNNLTIATGFEDDDLTLVGLVAKLKPGGAAAVVTVPPVANPYFVATQIGVPVSVNLLAYDSDPNSPPLPISVSSCGQPSAGSVALSGNTATFTPPVVLVPTTYTFPYIITNSAGLSATSTVTVLVTLVAPPLGPVANPDSVLTQEGVPVTINVLANDSDSNLIPLPISIASFRQPTTGGTVTESGTELVFTPNPGFYGTATFTYMITNSAGLTALSTVTVQVIAPPVANPITTTIPEGGTATINLLLADYDPNSPALALTNIGFTQPANGTVNTSTLFVGSTGSPLPVLIYTPNPGFTGTDTFYYTMSNTPAGIAGLTATSTVTVIVTPVQAAKLPPVANPVVTSTLEGVPVSINVLTNCSDPNTPPLALAVTTCSQTPDGTVSLSGNKVVFTPAPGFFGTVTFSYTIANAAGLTTSSTITVHVIGPPVAGPVFVSTPQGVPVNITVLTNCSDTNTPAQTPLTVTGFGQVNSSLGVVAQSGNTLSFTPASGFFGTVTFQYSISNAVGLPASSTVTVTVLGPPVAQPVTSSTQQGVPVTINVLASDYDQNSPALPLSITGFTQPTVSGEGTVTLSGTNLLFTPTANFVGTAVFSYTIQNSAGLTATNTVSVLVVQVSIVPPAVQLTLTGPSNVSCGSTITYTFAVTNTDTASETLTVVDPLLGGTIFSQANVAPGQGFVFTSNYTGALVLGALTNTAWAIGTASNGKTATNTASVTTVVTTLGVTSQIYCGFNSQNPGNGSLWLNSHIGANPGKPCNIYYQNASVTLTCNNGKTYTYPVPNGQICFSGTANSGNCSFNGTNWTTTLPCAGDSQIFLSGCAIPWQSAFAGCQSVCWTGTFSCDTAGINCDWQWSASCYNSSISNYNSIGVKPCYQTYCGYQQGDYAGTPENCKSYCQGGACNGNGYGYYGGSGYYTGSWSGAGNCSFTACPLAPVANPDSVTTQEGVAVSINVLAKDSDPNSPPLPLSIVSFTQPASSAGKVTQSGTNLVFTPAAGFVGTATFQYTIKDSTGLTATSTVTVQVTLRAPVANAASVSTPEGVAVSINVLGNDYDPNSPPLALTISSYSQPSGGVGAVTQSGTNLVFTPAAGYFGTVTFQYTVKNSAGLTSSSTVTVVVTPPPAVFLTLSGPATAPRDGTVTYTFAVTNTGLGSENLSVNDPLLGGEIFSQANVPAGQGFLFTLNYTAGSTISTLTNTAWAIGTVPNGASATNSASTTTLITTKCVTNQACCSFSPQNQGGYVWCNAHLACNPGKPCTVYCQNATVTFNCGYGRSYTFSVPDCQVNFTNCSAGSSSFNGSNWVTTLPSSGDSQVFLSGCGIPWQSQFANCQSVCWTGTFSCSTPGVNCQWQCGAAGYNCNLGNCGSVSVKACQQTSCGYNNSDYAGTPENCKSSFQNGYGYGYGYGGNNYCGSFSSAGSFSCQ